MKVLMFGWEFPPHNSGGLGVACQGLSRALVKKDIELTFVLPKKIDVSESGVNFRFANIANISMIEIDSLLRAYLDTQNYKKLRAEVDSIDDNYGNTLFEEVKRYSALARGVARAVPHDVIHAHDWLAFGAGIEAKKFSGKPFVAHVHATDVDRTGGNPGGYVYKKEIEGVNAADKILAVSQFTKDILINNHGADANKIEVVHNGINFDKYNKKLSLENSGLWNLKKMGYKIVLFTGRITIQKGPDYFMRAARKVIDHYPKTIFVVAGSGDMEGQMMKQAADMGISDKTVFAGFLRGEELAEAYTAADVFVMPSVSEPFGLVALEALLHNTPVIVSKQSGVSEKLKNAMKVDFWDTDEMADKIISVISHTSLKHEMTENGVRDVHECSWDSVADKCIQAYNSLI